MALPLPPGLTASEAAFLCEMEMVTVVPRQRLDSINLLGGKTPTLRPPHRATLPLWLALLLKKQRRANIVPPAWLHPASLAQIIHHETHTNPTQFSPPPPPPSRSDGRGLAHRVNMAGSTVLSPPFLPSCTAESPAQFLPYHWLEMAETLFAHAPDDMPASVNEIYSLIRDLVEIRAAKMRASSGDVESFGGSVASLRGVGSAELAENRAFVLGVANGVRKLGASTEATRREEEEAGQGDEESDEEMAL
ncbi:hypothetical protein RB594_004246 [Gaeumannomyces avenae]